jgi:hypothetical protein
MKNKYRIVKDRFLGYEVQIKNWWFPFFWFEMLDQRTLFVGTNTFESLEKAKEFLNKKKKLNNDITICYEE